MKGYYPLLALCLALPLIVAACAKNEDRYWSDVAKATGEQIKK